MAQKPSYKTAYKWVWRRGGKVKHLIPINARAFRRRALCGDLPQGPESWQFIIVEPDQECLRCRHGVEIRGFRLD